MSGSPTFDTGKKNRNGANLKLRHTLRVGGVITNSQAEQISLAVVDFTHFKRKRSLKIDRATFCTEWKSALTDDITY